jgi:enoyl-CoA hydratase
MTAGGPVLVERDGSVTVITLNRPQRRNAVDRVTADALAQAMLDYDADEDARVAVLTGAGGHFCAGADLQAFANGTPNRLVDPTGAALDAEAPMGPTRLCLRKPVIAAVQGYAVAGGLELALWCDLRVAGESAVFGVFCRRWGVPLIDGGTVRLPRIVGQGRALDLILTGRPVDAGEALDMGLVNRVVGDTEVLDAARGLAAGIAAFPQACLRADRASAYAQFDAVSWQAALAREFQGGREVLDEARGGAARFAAGKGRHGRFDDLAD